MLCFFSELDALVKNRLFNAFCSSFYGSELWDLESCLRERVNITWRKGLRRVWSLPPDTSCDLLYILSDSIPTYDELCRRFTGFVYSCTLDVAVAVATVSQCDAT